MRENRPSGSEGGESNPSTLPTPMIKQLYAVARFAGYQKLRIYFHKPRFAIPVTEL